MKDGADMDGSRAVGKAFVLKPHLLVAKISGRVWNLKNKQNRPLGLLACLLAVCTIPRASIPGPPAVPDGWPPVIKVVYAPVAGKESTLRLFEPFTAHLGEVLETRVEPVSFDTYEEAINALALGDFSLAYLTPSSYVQAARVFQLEVVAMELNESGQRGYRSIMICRADSKIAGLEGARGKSAAFANENSTSGFLVPLRHLLITAGESPSSYFSQVTFAGDHARVIDGVYKGLYDIGATNDMDFQRSIVSLNIPEKELRVLWTSDLIPGSPVCVKAGEIPSLKCALVGAVLMFNARSDDLAKLKIGGFAPGSNQDYRIVRELEDLGR